MWVCTGRKCRERQSEYILKRLKNDQIAYAADIDIEELSCQGNCQNAPIVCHYSEDVRLEYTRMNPTKASNIYKHIHNHSPSWKSEQ